MIDVLEKKKMFLTAIRTIQCSSKIFFSVGGRNEKSLNSLNFGEQEHA